jgi:hypothetical protein
MEIRPFKILAGVYDVTIQAVQANVSWSHGNLRRRPRDKARYNTPQSGSDRVTLNKTLHAIVGEHDALHDIAANTFGVKSLKNSASSLYEAAGLALTEFRQGLVNGRNSPDCDCKGPGHEP